MAVFMLDDIAGGIEVVVFPETFGKCGHLIAADAMLLVRGKLEKDEETARLVQSRAPADLAAQGAHHARGRDSLDRLVAQYHGSARQAPVAPPRRPPRLARLDVKKNSGPDSASAPT